MSGSILVERRLRPWWVVALQAGLWAAALGWVVFAIPVLATWVISGQSTSEWVQMLRLSGLAWVVAHDVPVQVGQVTYSLLPWGFVAIPALLLMYVGRWAGRSTRVETVGRWLLVALSTALFYTLIVGAVSFYVRIDQARTSVKFSVAAAGLLSVLTLLWGVLRGSPRRDAIVAAIPAPFRMIIRSGVIGLVVLIIFSATVVIVSLIWHSDELASAWRALHPGPVGSAALALLLLSYFPVAMMWGLSYALGAGFWIGAGVTMTPYVRIPAPDYLPPFPLLAALPHGLGSWAWLLPLVGVFAGVMMGLPVGRGRYPYRGRIIYALLSCMVAAIAVFILMTMSRGALGTQRLADLGPDPARTAGVCFALLAVGALFSALIIGSSPTPARKPPKRKARE